MTTIEVVMYPWQTVEDVEREQAEAEILADAEFQEWLDEVYAEPDIEAMTELEFLAYAADQAEAQNVEKTLMFAEQTLRAPRTGGWDLLPDWQRDGYVGM